MGKESEQLPEPGERAAWQTLWLLVHAGSQPEMTQQGGNGGEQIHKNHFPLLFLQFIASTISIPRHHQHSTTHLNWLNPTSKSQQGKSLMWSLDRVGWVAVGSGYGLANERYVIQMACRVSFGASRHNRRR